MRRKWRDGKGKEGKDREKEKKARGEGKGIGDGKQGLGKVDMWGWEGERRE